MEDINLIKEKIYNHKIMKAKRFAENAHGNQKYGENPYVSHLTMVARTCAIFKNEQAQVLGYLHDVLEDTEETKENIKNEFGEFMADCAELISDCKGINRKERKIKTNEKLSKIPEDKNIVLLVKAADRICNIVSCMSKENKGLFDMYKKEHTEFKKAVYRKGLCDDLWVTMDALITGFYNVTIKEEN